MERRWLDEREHRAWRSYLCLRRRLGARLNHHLWADSGMSEADYEILAVLSEHPEGRMSALALRCRLLWEKSRLSHQVRRMEERGLVAREANPADARSAVVRLTPEGRTAIEGAAPHRAERVREHFIDLLTPEELDTLTRIGERVAARLDALEGPGAPAA
ncbi:MarR family transcriptional regulator [Streptomyces calidiresistens]|uniref:MarR family transcriptional regulator n=1 Tax=Streptomyces calidiresistens TaxID=1485586 RepID=A0A7W3T0P5_9ACTN|nr:MarR family transcriptional regulator [Streptomyces calidiresistens]